jgi:hypothetical protein
MRRYSLVLLAVVISFASVPQKSVGKAVPIFHGFSDTNEMVVSVDNELLWLEPENDVPTFSIPVSQILFSPGACYIYFIIDTQLWMCDYNHAELDIITSEFDTDDAVQAMKNFLVISHDNKSDVYMDGELFHSSESLLHIAEFNDGYCLITKDGLSGALLLDANTGEVIGECIEDAQFSFIGEYIASTSNLGEEARIRSCDLKVLHTLEPGGAYFIRNNYLFRRFNNSVYIINPDNPDEKIVLPRFRNSYISDDLLVGITEDGDYLALELPTLIVQASNKNVDTSSSWIWFKDYESGIIVNMGDRGGLIDKDNGEIDILGCTPISGCGDWVFCSNGEDLSFLNITDGTFVNAQINAEKASVISNCGESCCLLFTNDESIIVASVDMSTGMVISKNRFFEDYYIVGAPQNTSFLEPLNSCDVTSISQLKREGFDYASPVFMSDTDPNTALVFQTGNKSPRRYISPLSFR